MIRPACLLLGTLWVALALVPSQAHAETHALYWQTSGQCWQTGQLGAENFTCENAAVPGYLNNHTISDVGSRSESLAAPASGRYCAYASVNGGAFEPKAEPAYFRELPTPYSSYQVADEHGDACASYAIPHEPLWLGLRLNSGPDEECDGAPYPICDIETYVSLATQGLADRPWGTVLGNPILHVDGETEPLEFQPKEGGGWGYLCPVVEEEKGNILELCTEQWRMAPNEKEEWKTEKILECRTPEGKFAHNVVKVMLPKEYAEEFWNPLTGGYFEELNSSFRTHVDLALSGPALEGIVDDVNLSYKEKTGTEARRKQPEVNYGCGIGASIPASGWALIGVANGIEEWRAGVAQAIDYPTTTYTSYEPLPIAISPSTAKETTPGQETLTGTINPNGFPTKYVVEYSSIANHFVSHEETVSGTGTSPVPVSITLTGLEPETAYEYRIEAYHYEVGTKNYRETDYGPVGRFTTGVAEQCSGANITAQGSSLQKVLQQQVWTTAFHTSSDSLACSGTQGDGLKPTVAYAATGSGAGLRSWGAANKTKEELAYGTTNAFIGTDEPPNEIQIGEIESHESKYFSSTETLESIPVAQESVAIIMHLPTGCTATSTVAEGRLVVNDTVLQGIFAGTVKTWGELTGSADGGDAITGTGCASDPITPVVREDQSGTTHILKRYLNLINAVPLAIEGGVSRTWGELSEASRNTEWPKAAGVLRTTAEGGGEEAAKVAATPGSIGYVNLAEARENTAFVPPSGGANRSTFWAEVENGHKGTGSKTKNTYQDPATNRDETAKASANCAKTTYTNGEEPFPPATVRSAWNAVTTSVQLKEKTYALCGLTYDLAFTNYAHVPSATEAEATTVRTYLEFVTAKAQGQTLLAGNDYSPLPKNIITRAEQGARASGGYN